MNVAKKGDEMSKLGRRFFGSLLAASALALPASPAEAQVRRYIAFENTCNFPVRVYISHADGYRNWHAHGPFIIPPREGPIRMEANGVTLTQTEDHELYFYAESLDASRIWDGSDHTVTYNGVNYWMRRANVEVDGGWLNARLTCSN
jgi:hypothetical protein